MQSLHTGTDLLRSRSTNEQPKGIFPVDDQRSTRRRRVVKVSPERVLSGGREQHFQATRCRNIFAVATTDTQCPNTLVCGPKGIVLQASGDPTRRRGTWRLGQ